MRCKFDHDVDEYGEPLWSFEEQFFSTPMAGPYKGPHGEPIYSLNDAVQAWRDHYRGQRPASPTPEREP